MDTKSVSVSGSVGKQVYPTDGTLPVVLEGYTIYAPTSAATVTIRSGNASGTIIHQGAALAQDSVEFEFGDIRFDQGMHVKVTGLNAVAYLYIE